MLSHPNRRPSLHTGDKVQTAADPDRDWYLESDLVSGDPQVLRRRPIGDEKHIWPGLSDLRNAQVIIFWARRTGVRPNDLCPGISLAQALCCDFRHARSSAQQEQRIAFPRTAFRQQRHHV